MADNYYDRDEWSCSQMKHILDSGIDYAVASKRRMIPQPDSRQIDLGKIVHMFCLGGEAEEYAVSPFDNFLTKNAREWRDSQKSAGKTVIDKKIYQSIAPIVDNIEAHPISKKLLKSDNVKHEIELYAKVNDVDLRGKADALLVNEDGALIITDIKATAQFDQFKYKARRRHYDLQAVIYSLLGGKALGISDSMVNFYFCVVETVFPYRVKYHHASPEFLESGERKLAKCLDEIKKFGDKEPNFLIEEVDELGDWSI